MRRNQSNMGARYGRIVCDLTIAKGSEDFRMDPNNALHAFVGMSMDTTRTEMTQAVLEGVVFALRDSLEIARSLGITVNSTKICGGGAKSPLWKLMTANILNLQVEVVENEEGPAFGAAILAEAYDKCYRKFRRIYPALKDVFAKMQQNQIEKKSTTV